MILMDAEDIVIAGDLYQLMFEIAYLNHKLFDELKKQNSSFDKKQLKKQLKNLQKIIEDLEKNDPNFPREVMADASSFVKENLI
jgi:hypothetical protein